MMLDPTANAKILWQSLNESVKRDPYPNLDLRLHYLSQLESKISASESQILAAMQADFNKAPFETYVMEIDQVIKEIQYVRKNLPLWITKQTKEVSLSLFPSGAYSQLVPRGVVLIISPWNYPIYLSLMPVIGAIAAGNRFVLKPSELTQNTSELLASLIADIFPEDYATVVQGGAETGKALLEQRWDLLCFTGSTRVGQIVYEQAAKNLTPVLLELGGKSPVIIFPDASLKRAAKRIIWGKGMNAGQTCVAPDLVFVPKDDATRFTEYLQDEIKRQWQANTNDSAAIINEQHFSRLKTLIEENREQLVFGGQFDVNTRKISLALMTNPKKGSRLLTEEIFGPILPIITYDTEEELLQLLKAYCDESLAAYFFGKSEAKIESFMQKLKFGGACINDVVIHLGIKESPFGGVGRSGIGSYHGFHSLKTFSHERTVAVSGSVEFPLRYPPYKNKLNWLKKILKYL